MQLNAEHIKQYLSNDPEGKRLFQELTAGIEQNKNEILSEKKQVKTQLEQFQRQYEQLQAELDRQTQRADSLVYEREINSAFDDIKVIDPAYRKTLKSFFKEGIIIEGDEVFKGDKPLLTYMLDWAASADAMPFINPGNSGANSQRFSGIKGDATITKGMSSQEILNKWKGQ